MSAGGYRSSQFDSRQVEHMIPSNKATKSSNRLARKEAIEGFLCIAPWLVGFLVLTLGPMIFSFIISLTKWDLINSPKFVGFSNYSTIFTDDFRFRRSLWVTVRYAALSLPLGM